MRVLIIGAQGMLGQELIRAFTGADVVDWDRSDLDITDVQAVRARIKALHPDVCVNAAAYNAVDRAEAEEEIAHRVNGDAVGFLAEAAATIGAMFVHYSTDYVFDGSRHDGYVEDDMPNPVNAYGRSKLAGERALFDVAAKCSRPSVEHPLRWYMIRTSRLFGSSGLSTNTKRSFVDTMVALSATKDRLEVVDGEMSSPTYAPDLAAATRVLVTEDAPSGVYHRTNDGACTWYGFAKEIFRITGWRGMVVPVTASVYSRPAKRPTYSVLRTTKLPLLRRWEEVLAEYIIGMTNAKAQMPNQIQITKPFDI